MRNLLFYPLPMLVSDFDYSLPEDRIARYPAPQRDASRMLVVHRKEGWWEDRLFTDLPDYLSAGDCLVVNDTKVFPARLFGHRERFTGKVEIFLVRPVDGEQRWLALVRPGRKLRSGDRVIVNERLRIRVLGRCGHGERIVQVECNGNLDEELERAGHIPLPPYLDREDEAADRERYQTVYAKQRGSVAAPTAGLHFTPAVLDACRARGADIARLTLHVGLGTFQPLHAAGTSEVKLHAEWFSIAEGEAVRMREARRRIAVGTTSVRAIETAMRRGGLKAMTGETDLFIQPGFVFQATNAMLTNFHLPQSSLLILVCAVGGRELILDAYRHAVASGYRFYSYGDCMLIC